MNAPLSLEPSPGLAPARSRRSGFQTERLLVIDPHSARFADHSIAALPRFLRRQDLLVLNDAATLPASLWAEPELELRLVAEEDDGSFWAVSFGAGDWHLPTEARGSPRALHSGEFLRFSAALGATIVERDTREPRWVRLRFNLTGASLYQALYAAGRPIQYAYLERPLALWDVQNGYAARPVAFELPSAGRPLTFTTLFELERRGVTLARVTHAAGISSTGSASHDARLPLPERYEIGSDASAALARTRSAGGRVIAAGTSVVRALEGAVATRGALRAGTNVTDLLLSAQTRPRVVNGLLTGLHDAETTHFALMEAFAPRALLLRALAHAARAGYVQHEFGDSCLLLAGALGP